MLRSVLIPGMDFNRASTSSRGSVDFSSKSNVALQELSEAISGFPPFDFDINFLSALEFKRIAWLSHFLKNSFTIQKLKKNVEMCKYKVLMVF